MGMWQLSPHPSLTFLEPPISPPYSPGATCVLVGHGVGARPGVALGWGEAGRT